MFVADRFDWNLDEIVSSQALRVAADDLVMEFEQDGDTVDLIWALHQERPRNPEVKALMQRLQGFLEQRWVLDPTVIESEDTSVELPKAYSDIELEGFLPQPVSYEADVGQLRRGLQLANAVCKIAFSDRPTTGTGVLIAPDLVLTNYHVLSRQIVGMPQLAEKAKTALCEFGFVSEEHDMIVPPDTLAVDSIEPVLAASPPAKLDYVLLRVNPQIMDVAYDYIQPITPPPHPLTLNSKDGLNVLQHPAGNVMQVSLSASGVVQVDAARDRLWYVNRTQGGSSGAPCFNADWQMVALHHASMSRGFGSVREGILMSSILAEISEFLA